MKKKDIVKLQSETSNPNAATLPAAENNDESPAPQTPKQKFVRIIKKYAKRYFIDAFSGMAQGLFCTLVTGTILGQIGEWIALSGTDEGLAVSAFVISVSKIAKLLMGVSIGVGIAHALKTSKLVLFTAGVAGLAGAFADSIIAGTFAASFAPGNPIGAYVASIFAIEIGQLVSGRTIVDIVLVPLTMMVATIFGLYLAWPFIKLLDLIGLGIGLATQGSPESMSIIVAVSIGLLLTLPTSSAATWIAIASPVLAAYAPGSAMHEAMLLAGGAAVTGCACHMIGFAVQSFRENKWGGFIAQSLGTSKIQLPNAMRHPQILIPPVAASIIAGPIATCVFGLKCNAVGGGMGTSGLVGVFGTIAASQGVIADWKLGVGIALCFFVIPAVVCFFISEIMRKFKWIKFGDMKLEI
jgi:uncharacterized membrane protein